MKNLKRLLLENKAWARSHSEVDPRYFELMAEEQSPEILWIGCSDSRVPPDEILNTKPGNIFVHRNLGNLVYEDDENLMSVIEYAVEILNVKYIVLCGHYGCGGVQAAYNGMKNEKLKNWTRKIANLKQKEQIQDMNLLVERSICEQVESLKKIPTVAKAMKKENGLKVIGWVYDMKTGLMNPLS